MTLMALRGSTIKSILRERFVFTFVETATECSDNVEWMRIADTAKIEVAFLRIIGDSKMNRQMNSSPQSMRSHFIA